jgi:hypothetical protein
MRLTDPATITTPNRYDKKAWESTVPRIRRSRTVVSDTVGGGLVAIVGVLPIASRPAITPDHQPGHRLPPPHPAWRQPSVSLAVTVRLLLRQHGR